MRINYTLTAAVAALGLCAIAPGANAGSVAQSSAAAAVDNQAIASANSTFELIRGGFGGGRGGGFGGGRGFGGGGRGFGGGFGRGFGGMGGMRAFGGMGGMRGMRTFGGMRGMRAFGGRRVFAGRAFGPRMRGISRGRRAAFAGRVGRRGGFVRGVGPRGRFVAGRRFAGRGAFVRGGRFARNTRFFRGRRFVRVFRGGRWIWAPVGLYAGWWDGYGYGYGGSCYWNCRAAGYGPGYCSAYAFNFC